MTLVKLCCFRCGRILKRIDQPPRDWSGTVSFLRCRKCDLPPSDRIVDVLISSGRDGFPMTGEMPWKQLKALIAKAQRTGKTQRLDVRVVEPDRHGDGVS